jgi:radical SAM superfamily enzyme YgiQ (UPF0313 family)
MKLLLVKAPSDMHSVTPPLSLAYLVPNAKKYAEIRILDCLKEKYSFNDFEKYVRYYSPDVIGFTAFTMEINSVFKCAKITKKINEKIFTIVGGPHASTFPENILENKNIDFVFISEAENHFPQLLKQIKEKKFNLKQIPNFGFREKGDIIINEITLENNLDSLPFPDFDLMNFNEYPKLYLAKKHPSIPILTSRGCPFNCTFCTGYKISGKKFRARSPENIIKELKILKQKYNIKEFQIWDDNFTLDKKRAMDFCNLLIEEKLNLIWWCPNGVRMETLDYELLKKMKDSGCYAIVLGIESGSEKIQKDMNKNLNFKKLNEIVNIAYTLKLRTQGFFIIGYPTETKKDIIKTINLAKNLPLDRATFGLFQPLPGSDIFNQLKKQGKLNGINFEKIEYSKPSIALENVSLNELKKLQQRALIEFYLRPKVFFKFLKENLTPSQFKEILNMIKQYILNK